MVASRPYWLVFKGEQHIIEATSAALAVQHVVGADITELRPARAAEVTAWARQNKPIPIAGEKPTFLKAAESGAATGGQADVEPPAFTVDEAKAWLAMQKGGSARTPFHPLGCWAAMQREDRMDLEDFDAMRVQVPAFGEAMLGLPAARASTAADVQAVRVVLENAPMPFGEMVRLIGEAARHESLEQEPAPAGEETMVGTTGHLDG